ncbi:PKD domain-containing protein [Echinimonas agarilytica]|uniref:DUF1566 domain-containing protein n=1 Tax=Echinimonas agarilytica TaxID=1215918 RepID=A0AA41W888_9GAMM|nr:DUF1566 domain-containing protein [Echinimonas agarilytica]MCM2680084.1 DUF1566 domain-containing protein [Echinimonas agarilytica]
MSCLNQSFFYINFRVNSGLGLLLFLVGCDPSDSSPEISVEPFLQVVEGQPVELTVKPASSSYLEFHWEQLTGPEFAIQDSNQQSIVAIAPLVSEDRMSLFSVEVRNSLGKKTQANVEVLIINENSVPVLSTKQQIETGEYRQLTLSAEAYDPDGEHVEITWRQELENGAQKLEVLEKTPDSITVQIPKLDVETRFNFVVEAIDSHGSMIHQNVQVNGFPVLSGRVIDEPIASASLFYKNWNNEELFSLGLSDDAGRFEVLLRNDQKDIEVIANGGVLNNQNFEGQLKAICRFEQRSSCNLTPVTTLIAQYANDKGILNITELSQYRENLEAVLGPLEPDPFIQVRPDIDVAALRSFFGDNGSLLDVWIEQVLTYVEQPNNHSSQNNISSWFQNSNQSPSVSLSGPKQAEAGSTVVLTALALDPEQSDLRLSWQQTQGPVVSFDITQNDELTFISPELIQEERLFFEVQVEDDVGLTANANISLTVLPIAIKPPNVSPTVSAGNHQTVDEATSVTLNASASDDDGSIAAYQWTQTAGTTVLLSGATTASASFTAPTLTSAETLRFEVMVTDNENATTSAPVSVLVEPVNALPTVSAGNHQTVDEATSVTLNASASDDDGSIAAYQWTQTAGTTVLLSGATTASASFTAPTLTSAETLRFEVTVTDNENATTSAPVSVLVEPVNALPTVSAGNHQTVDEATSVTLNASASDDDGSIAAYQWTQTAGTTVLLSGATTASASFTAPDVTSPEDIVFTVDVTDNEGGTAQAQITVTIVNNNAPIASAKAPLQVKSGRSAQLDATESIDDESISLSFDWVQTDSTGTAITLTDDSSAQPSFIAPTVTTSIAVQFQVSVTDEGGKSDSASVNFILSPDDSAFAPMNDTGFALCGDYAYGAARSGNHQNNLDCADSTDVESDPIPEDQDGHFGRDINFSDSTDGARGFSFVKLDANGSPLDANATSWDCVYDAVTQLVWEVKTNDGGLQDSTHSYTWYNTDADTNGGGVGSETGGVCADLTHCNTQEYQAAINAEQLCGLTTWRMPAYIELLGIQDLSQSNPAIDVNYFPNTQGTWHWTATPASFHNDWAWTLTFDLSNTLGPVDFKASAYPIRLVADFP